MKTVEAFAANVRRFRQARGMTQGELAALIGVTTHTVFHYESAARWPRDEGMDGLAKALKVRPWQLLAEEGEGGAIPPEVVEHVAAAARACGLQMVIVDPSMGSGHFVQKAAEILAGQAKPPAPRKPRKS